MISINLLQEEVEADITRMPVAEFCGRTGLQHGHLYEIKISEALTVVMDEQQLIDLTEAALDALPPQDDITDLENRDDDDDKGEAWKNGGPV